MIIPIFSYAKCDPTFQKEVLDPLEKVIADIQEMPGEEFTVEKTNLIKAAICKYADWNIIPEEYWRTLIGYFVETDDELDLEIYDDEIIDMLNKALDHFVHEESPVTDEDAPDSACYYLMDVNRYFDNDCPKEPVHDFPHDSSFRMFIDYLTNVMTRHPPKEIMEKWLTMMKLYFEIKAAEDDAEKWFNLLLGVNIDKFLRSNVEYRLGLNLLDRQLWKLYIGYLKDVDPKAMLVVYSKYVRFFMDDKDMLEEYKQQMEEHGPVKLLWKNLREFEKQPQIVESVDDNIEDANGEENVDVSVAVPPFNPQICATFYNNVDRQKEFSFLKPTIDYILDKASEGVLQKLFKSGKYFFARKSTPICYRLVVHDDITAFDEESVALNYLDNIMLDNILISCAMKVQWLSDQPVPEIFKMFTSTLIPHLSRCDAVFIKLNNQNLSFEELKFLIKGGRCIELELPDCEIKDENGNHVQWEKIMELLPNVMNLVLPTVKVKCITARSLSVQRIENNGINMIININEPEPFDVEEFKNYCLKFFTN